SFSNPPQPQPPRRQLVECRRFDITAIAAQIAEAHIVRHDHDDVRAGSRGNRQQRDKRDAESDRRQQGGTRHRGDSGARERSDTQKQRVTPLLTGNHGSRNQFRESPTRRAQILGRLKNLQVSQPACLVVSQKFTRGATGTLRREPQRGAKPAPDRLAKGSSRAAKRVTAWPSSRSSSWTSSSRSS